MNRIEPDRELSESFQPSKRVGIMKDNEKSGEKYMCELEADGQEKFKLFEKFNGDKQYLDIVVSP